MTPPAMRQTQLAPAVSALPGADVRQWVQMFSQFFDQQPVESQNMFTQSMLQRRMTAMTAVSLQSSTQTTTTAAYAIPIVTTSIVTSGTTTVTTTHGTSRPTIRQIPYRTPLSQTGYQNSSWCSNTMNGQPLTYNYSTAPSFTDPLFAETETPQITTNNTEHSVAKLEGCLDINGIYEDERLPQQVILVDLSTEETLHLERMAVGADSNMEYHNGSTNAVSKSPKSDPMSVVADIISRTNERLEELKDQSDGERRSIPQSRHNPRQRDKEKQRSEDRRRSPTPTEETSDDDDEPQPCQNHVWYGRGQHLNWQCHYEYPLFMKWLQAQLDRTEDL